MLGMYAIMGIALAFNVLVLKFKLEDGRYGDFAIDILSLVILSALFGQTLGGLMIVTVASAVISITLFFFPPQFG